MLSLSISISPGNLCSQSTQSWANGILGQLEEDQGKGFLLIKEYSDTLLQIYKASNDDCNYIRTLCYKANYQIQSGNYKEVLETAELSHKTYLKKTCSDKILYSKICLVYCAVYYNLKELKKADMWIQKGIESWPPKENNTDVLERLYLFKGLLYSDLKNQKFYYDKTYSLAEKSGNLAMQEHALKNIGTAYAMNGESALADEYLKQALSLALKRNAYNSLSTLYNNLAGLPINKSKMKIYIDSAYYYAKLSGSLVDILNTTENYAYLYYDNGKYKIASDTLFALLNLKDMFFSQEKIKAFADMEQKYESEKKNSTIKLLKSKNEIAALQAARNLAVIIGLGIALLGIVLIAYLFYSQSNKRKKLNTDLSIEKKKSDDLLLNILPPEVAEELKSKGSADAKQFENVTVLFTDFENFTQISEQMSPIELVKTLNTFFEAFDNIITRLDIEKIKTIGDSYMCVGGLPIPTLTHAEDVVQAAIEMQQFVSQYAKEQEAQGKKPLLIRIGINSGPVIAGIVGNKKYAYDIWGDTVNTASRMENSGSVGKINISGSTYELIKEKFICTPRGKIAAKNKGQLDMYFVEGRI